MKTKTKFFFKTIIVIPFWTIVMLLSFSVHSQTNVYNEAVNSGMFIDGNGASVANPVSDAVNSSANCARSGTGGWKKVEYFPTYAAVSASKLYFSVYNPNSAGPGQVKFEYASAPGVEQFGDNVTYVSGSVTGWREYSINLTSHAGNTITKILMYPSGPSATATFVDNIYFGTSSTLPVLAQTNVYNQSVNSGMFIDGDGAEVANPVSDAVNSSANCARSGTGGWKKVEYFPTYTVVSSSKLYFSVYNPNSAGPGQVKFEYSSAPGVEQFGDNVTYVSGSLTGWVEYSIDLASKVGNTINKILMYPSGPLSGATYVDNIYFGSIIPQQTVVYNQITNSGMFIDGDGASVANPFSDIVNSSANCARSGTGGWKKVEFFPNYSPVSGSKLYFSVYNPNNSGPGQVKFEYASAPGVEQFGDNVTYVSGPLVGWREYSIDLTSHLGNTITKILMYPSGPSATATFIDNVYFANISLTPAAQERVVYDETISSGMFIDGNGAQLANPLSDVVNPSANCARSGTGGWIKVEYFPNYTVRSGNRLYFSVYNPNNAGPGQVKFEYSTAPGVEQFGDNVTYLSTSITGWREYSINLTSHLGKRITKILMYPSGPSSGATYVDNVYFSTVSITPAPIETQLRPTICGRTLRFINQRIEASPFVGATEYTFEVTRVSNNVVTTIVSPNYLFNPATAIPGGLVWGEAYSVKVKIKVGGIYYLYGNACIVTAPAEPLVTTTKIRPFQCGKTLLYMTQPVEATPVYLATTYEFEVTSGAGTFVKSSANHTFSLYYSVPGRALTGTAYTIRVRSKGAATAFTAWGDPCVVTTPIARMSDASTNDVFEVKSFPNPFASHFSLDIESSSDAQVEMKVYDMIGRQLEVRKASVSELSVLEVGRNYPTGIYNLVVSQGEKVKSLRMVKR